MEMEGVSELGVEGPYVRSLADVNSVIHHAKLSRSDLKQTSQVLYFSSEFPEYKLFECDGVLLKHLEGGGELHLRGRATDKVVVCTTDQTYDLKGAETSNSLLLVPGLKMAEEVPVADNAKNVEEEEEKGEGGEIEEKRIVGVYGEYFELKKIKPRMGRLRTLLLARPYNGPENEVDVSEEPVDARTYSFSDLLEEVQASEGEIRRHLDELDAVEINGRWRMLDHEYQFRALSFLLNLIEGNSWPADGVPIGETMSTLNGLVPDVILDHICRVYLQPTEDYSEDGDKLYRLDEFKICRFLGESLLKPVDKFNLDDFLKAWSSSVPAGLQTDLKQLDGLALYNDNTNPPVIWYFPESKLPEDLSERFAVLFKERRAWELNQIAPYVSSFATEKQTVNALLTKHARSANVGGRKIYSSRHGK
uniref:Sister chromatid cohesion protein DCC1 n=1 Tax=Lygus hesperus TaxID=30085 RepID=A0A0A9WMG4_LYGHE